MFLLTVFVFVVAVDTKVSGIDPVLLVGSEIGQPPISRKLERPEIGMNGGLWSSRSRIDDGRFMVACRRSSLYRR